jgi:hypothetical protein
MVVAEYQPIVAHPCDDVCMDAVKLLAPKLSPSTVMLVAPLRTELGIAFERTGASNENNEVPVPIAPLRVTCASVPV